MNGCNYNVFADPRDVLIANVFTWKRGLERLTHPQARHDAEDQHDGHDPESRTFY